MVTNQRRLLSLVVPTIVLAVTLSVGPHSGEAAGTTLSDPFRGRTTAWRVSQVSVHSMYRLPGVPSSQYYRGRHWQFYVAMFNISNVGTQAAAPADDLVLAMKVLPRYFTLYTPGWGSPPRDKPYDTWTRAVAARLGGVPGWITEKPGEKRTYCYVFLTVRGEHHYGLYNKLPGRPYKFLLDMGI